MQFPIRMNLVAITIRKLDVAGTPKDPDFREAKRAKKFNDVELQGQVNFGGGNVDDRLRTHTGDEGPSGAWLMFRIADLERDGYEPKKGDRVTKIAGRDVALEIRQAKPESPLQGKFLLLKCVVEEVKEDRASL